MSQALELLKDLGAKLEKQESELSAKAENALKEAQNAGTLSTETKALVDKMLAETNDTRKTLSALEVQLGEAEKAWASVDQNPGAAVSVTAGSLLANSEQAKAFASRVSANERDRISIGMPRSALTSSGVADGVIEPHRLPGIMQAKKQRLFVRDLIPSGKTDSPAIYWVQQTGFTNNAATVPENTLKPTSEIDFGTQITPVTTVAHLFKASKQIMDDFSQLQTLVDAELRYGLKYVEEQQMLYGDGLGANLKGIMPQASAYKGAFDVDKQNGIDDIRLAMLQAQLARLPASGVVMHYQDWAKIELLKDANGNYIFGNPSGLAYPVLWGLPVVETEIVAFKDKFLTGAFESGAQIFDREDANVVISTENNDDFEKNMLTIRCEERLALAVYRPEAFITGSFTVTP
ncbi:MAG: phage major capsid protein [Neisseriaceae bacterium]|nr:phage major capsid protein [Neisseriaceae bacterium]